MCGGSGQVTVEITTEQQTDTAIDVAPLDVWPEMEKTLRSNPELFKSVQNSPGTKRVIIEAAQLGYFLQHVLKRGKTNGTYRLELGQREWLMTLSSSYQNSQGTFRDYSLKFRENQGEDYRHSRHTAMKYPDGRWLEVDPETRKPLSDETTLTDSQTISSQKKTTKGVRKKTRKKRVVKKKPVARKANKSRTTKKKSAKKKVVKKKVTKRSPSKKSKPKGKH
jgi:hypothetical protein